MPRYPIWDRYSCALEDALIAAMVGDKPEMIRATRALDLARTALIASSRAGRCEDCGITNPADWCSGALRSCPIQGRA